MNGSRIAANRPKCWILHSTACATRLRLYAKPGRPNLQSLKIMGHSSVVVTEQHYGHLDRSVLTEEIKNIEGIVTLPKLSAASMEPAPVVNKVVKVVNGPVLSLPDRDYLPDDKHSIGEVAERLKAAVC